MKPLALVVPLRDEAVVLPRFIAHYALHLPPEDVYVLFDHLSQDESAVLCRDAGFNVEVVCEQDCLRWNAKDPRRSFDPIVKRVTSTFAGLLRSYANVAFTDADDLLAPADGCRLDTFRFNGPFCTAYDVSIITDPDTGERHHLNIAKFNNPTLWHVEPYWTRGFHNIKHKNDKGGAKPGSDGRLLLIDTHMEDFNVTDARHRARTRYGFNPNVVSCMFGDPLRARFKQLINAPQELYNGVTVLDASILDEALWCHSFSAEMKSLVPLTTM